MLQAETGKSAGSTEGGAKPKVVYRYSLVARGFVIGAAGFTVLFLAASAVSGGFSPFTRLAEALVGAAVLAYCALYAAVVFSRVELYEGRLTLHRPFRLPSSTVRFNSPFEVTERRWWWNLDPTCKELRISGMPDEIKVLNLLRGYNRLRTRLQTLQAEQETARACVN